MASVNMEQAKKKFHATDRLEVHPSSKPGSSTFFCLGYLLTNGLGEEQREITEKYVKFILSHRPTFKRNDLSFGMQKTIPRRSSISERRTEVQVFLSPESCNFS